MAPSQKKPAAKPPKRISGYSYSKPFATSSHLNSIPLHAIAPSECAAWLKNAAAPVKLCAKQAGFTGKPGQILPLYDEKGGLREILTGVNTPLEIYDFSAVADYLAKNLDEKTLQDRTFVLRGVAHKDIDRACLGWGLAAYHFDTYKNKKNSSQPLLVWPEKVDKKAIAAQLESAVLIRNLINTPSNDMGPQELEMAAHTLADAEGLSITVIHDKDLLKQNFPMIHAVGRGSSRRPRLIDMQWGNAKHPKVTLVGKGVCFDTGGLDIKPSAAMYTMKKDMGGAAHVLGLALLIIRYKLPVRLRVLIPAVENSISGDSFRPSDVLKSRKGITVEVGDTDAEGRLVLADALTLACEEKPDLIFDFATLTGAARVALGPDLPVIFSNREKISFALKDISMTESDPVWPLPLWQGYRRDIASDIADTNSVGGKAGAITAALFLESFVDEKIDWVHIDLYAWNDSARPGRTKGGTEMTTRTIMAYLQSRFGKK